MDTVDKRRVRVGVISDTHGLLRPAVLPIFKGVEMIIHAGDIGSPEVLDSLRSVAPVVAVRGNNDTERWAKKIPETAIAKIAGASLYVLHDLKELSVNVAEIGFAAVISGHSHRPVIDERDGVLYVNPGSAGPRRFKLPISVARLVIQNGKVQAELIHIPL
jgi:putative phosphoesterase